MLRILLVVTFCCFFVHVSTTQIKPGDLVALESFGREPNSSH